MAEVVRHVESLHLRLVKAGLDGILGPLLPTKLARAHVYSPRPWWRFWGLW